MRLWFDADSVGASGLYPPLKPPQTALCVISLVVEIAPPFVFSADFEFVCGRITAQASSAVNASWYLHVSYVPFAVTL